MSSQIVFPEDFRNKIWDMLINCGYDLDYLKGIVQNEMPVLESDLEIWFTIKERLIKKLNDTYADLFATATDLINQSQLK